MGQLPENELIEKGVIWRLKVLLKISYFKELG